jgi:hypothetical protein
MSFEEKATAALVLIVLAACALDIFLAYLVTRPPKLIVAEVVSDARISALLERPLAPASAELGRHAADETGSFMRAAPWTGVNPYCGRHWTADVEHTDELHVTQLRAYALAGER